MTTTAALLPRGPLMVDVAGLTLTDAERALLVQPIIGAVILFARNFSTREQLKILVAQIKTIRTPALLIAVDQEGGRVQRFGNGFFRLPPLLSVGRVFDQSPQLAIALAFDAGRLMAAELRQVDIDFSFAPVVDVANPASRIIGDRAFHQSPATVAKIAESYIRGMHSAGMQATAKHFPGHGNVVADSHFETPVDTRNYKQILATDLVPYRVLAPLLGGVMTAHIYFPEVTANLPAFSSYWLGQVLRNTIGFKGLVLSDDLSMKGAHIAGDILSRARLALDAGCDMVLICNDPKSVRQVVADMGNRHPPMQSRLQNMLGMPGNIEQPEIDSLWQSIAPLVEAAEQLDANLQP